MNFSWAPPPFLKGEQKMSSYLQQENLAQLKYAELLADAEWERRLAPVRRERPLRLLSLLLRTLEQVRHWFAPSQPAAVDQAC
jgi:hypothetical protein